MNKGACVSTSDNKPCSQDIDVLIIIFACRFSKKDIQKCLLLFHIYSCIFGTLALPTFFPIFNFQNFHFNVEKNLLSFLFFKGILCIFLLHFMELFHDILL